MRINFLLILLFFFSNISYSQSVEYYVDGENPSASDANPGTKELPLKSIEAAKILVSLNKGSLDSSITVWIRQGTYYLNDTLHFREKDSGSAQLSILYQAYPGEKVIITGKKKLPYELFQPVTSSDALWNQIDQSVKSKLVFIDLNTLGISDYGTLAPPKFKISTYLQLFINDVWMPMARWPDILASGNTPILNAVDAGFTKFQKGDTENSFYLPSDRIARWENANDIMVHGFLNFLWFDAHIKVKSLDIPNRKINIEKRPLLNVFEINDNDGQLYIYNLIEEITQPGEWFLSQSTGRLYLWPPSNFQSDNIAISMLQKPILKLDNVRFLKFKNLEFNGGKQETILVSNSHEVEFDECKFLNSGTNAVFVEHSTNFILQSSTITGTGGSAVTFKNCGSRPALIESNNLIQNTEISQIGKRVFAQAYAVDIIKSIGINVINNELHDGPHSAVLFTGNENKILRNKIYNFCSKTSDAGAIYTGRDWGYRGNIIKNNFIYDIQSVFGSDVHGVYLDDAVAASSTIGNVFSNISGVCVFHRGGRDITVTDNIFHKCGTAYHLQDIGIRKITNEPGHPMNFFERLINDGIDYKKEPWASKYPRLFAIPKDWAQASDPANKWLYPGGSIVSRNLGYQNGKFIEQDGRDNIIQDLEDYSHNLENVNPLFKNEAQLNFALLPNSPAFAIPNFEDIPFSDIGLIKEVVPGVLSSVKLDHNSHHVGIAPLSEDAVIITGPPSYQGKHPGVIRVKKPRTGGFDLRFQEWEYLDGFHKIESVPYLVLEQGRHIMSDGSIWEVGTFTLNGTANWVPQTFLQPFVLGVPQLFLTAQSSHGGQAVSVRGRNVTQNGFEAALFEQEQLMDGHKLETIGYLAIYSAKPAGHINLGSVSVPYQLQSVALSHQWQVVLGSALKLEEEQSADLEVRHKIENIDVLGLGSYLFAQDVSSAGGDSVALRQKRVESVLTVNGGTGGGSYFAGIIVNITADPPPVGRVFDAWTGDTSLLTNLQAANTTLTMPTTQVTLTATYRDVQNDVWTDLFDGTSFDGWSETGEGENFAIENGEIVGTAKANESSAFLKTVNHYGDFVLEVEFKVDATMNSGIQFRSKEFSLGDSRPSWMKDPLLHGQLYGSQVEIDPSKEKTGGIVDYGRKDGIWLDDLADNQDAKAAFIPGAWNTLRLEVIGTRLKTWLNNVPAADTFDPNYLSGFIALEIPADVVNGAQIRWRNIRIQDRNVSTWEPIFNKQNLHGWHSSRLDLWSVENGMLHGVSQNEPKNSMLFTDNQYTDFTIRVVYRISSGDSGLFFRTDETWTGTFNGVQADIQSDVDRTGWTTSLYEGGIGGRKILTSTSSPFKKLVNSVYKNNQWNEMIISGYGNRVITYLNGVKTVDSKTDLLPEATDDIGRRKGFFGLQMHKGSEMDIEFKDIEVLRSTVVNSVSEVSIINTTESQVNLQWNRVDDAISYQIWRDGILIDEVWNTTYPDSFLNPEMTYTYTIVVNNGFAISQPSKPISATTQAVGGSQNIVLYPYENLTVTASSRLGGEAKQAFNNLGMVDPDSHNKNPLDMWGSSNTGEINGQWIKVDLGSIQTLDHLRVWNYNSSLETDINSETDRGVKQADIYYALTDPEHRSRDLTDTYFHPAGWTLLQANQPFTRSPGGRAIKNTDPHIDLNQVQARYIAIKIDSNYGDPLYVGLSEVQIYVADKQ